MSTATAAPALPAGARTFRVAFVTERPPAPLTELPPPIGRFAVELPSGFRAGAQPAALEVLAVPVGEGEDADAIGAARAWAEASGPAQFVSLHGAQVVWGTGRAAVLAAPDRLDGAVRAVLESEFLGAELKHLERALGALWPDLEADGPLAFEFEPRAVRTRHKLAGRFRTVLELRARLARLSPHVHLPPVFPPTLASQIGERLRERARMPHRAESLETQLEVFERVYDGCAQRASEFVLARRSHALEWVIIILLYLRFGLIRPARWVLMPPFTHTRRHGCGTLCDGHSARRRLWWRSRRPRSRTARNTSTRSGSAKWSRRACTAPGR